MKIIIGSLIISGISFLLGQANIMMTFEPKQWYESTIELAQLAYTNGCVYGSQGTMVNECKEKSKEYEKQLRSVRRVK